MKPDSTLAGVAALRRAVSIAVLTLGLTTVAGAHDSPGERSAAHQRREDRQAERRADRREDRMAERREDRMAERREDRREEPKARHPDENRDRREDRREEADRSERGRDRDNRGPGSRNSGPGNARDRAAMTTPAPMSPPAAAK